MEISGAGGPKHSAYHSRYSTRDSGSPEQATAQAENDAAARIAQAQQSVQSAQLQSDQQVQQIHDEGDARTESESAREDAALEAQKQKGYERIRDVQRAQAQELARIKREGEKERQDINDYYKLTLSSLSRDGDEKVRDTQNRSNQEFTYAKKSGDAQMEDLQAEHWQALQRIRDHQAQQTHDLAEEDRREYEKLVQNSSDARTRSQKHFQDGYQQQVKQEDSTLNNLYNTASKKIREVRQDTSQKLAAYNSRQNDPFYKMMDVGAKLVDNGDHYELRARIPEHEQDHATAIVRGNQLVVQGYRRNEEKLDLAPGRMKNSSTYETYQETFPLTWPVDAKRMNVQFEGDTMIVRVPKANEYAFQPHQAKRPERVHAERPKFPENIPHTKTEYPSSDSPETEKPLLSKGSLESRTLS